MSSLQVTNEARMDVFLKAFAKTGTIYGAINAVSKAHDSGRGVPKLSRTVVYNWKRENYLGFADRLIEAGHEFREYLESLALDHAAALKPGQNPTMLLGLLNANYPEKWRRSEGVAGADDPREALAGVRIKLKELKNSGDLTVEVIAGNGASSHVARATDSAEPSGISDRRESPE